MTLHGTMLPSLVGRERELDILGRTLDAALAGRGSLMLIGGEAGIGKTALATALCREAAPQGALVLTGRCYDLTETPPYGPWVDLFERYRPDDALPPPPLAFAARGLVGPVPSQTALFRQAQDFFVALAAARPVVLLLDDLHWADPASLDLLRALARSLPTLPLLLLVTYRADELSPTHPLTRLLLAILREAPVERLDLRPLRADDTATLVTGRYCLPDADTTRLAAYTHQRAEGNPLFLGELLRTLEEEGALQRTTAGWTLGFLATARVPPLLRQIIEGRAARLEGESQRLLAIAAVLGQAVPLDIWARVASVPERVLLGVMAQATIARLAEATEDGRGVRFVHALIREALYEGLSPPARRLLHRAAGEMLAAGHAPDPDAVASHFQRAGDARATEWLVQAGDRAQRAHAWSTAAERFRAALSILDIIPADDARRGWLRLRTALVLRYTQRGIASTLLDEALRLGVQAGDVLLIAAARCYHGHVRAHSGDLEGVNEMEAGVEALESLSASDRAQFAQLLSAGVTGVLADDASPRSTLAAWLTHVGRYHDAQHMAEKAFAEESVTRATAMDGTSAFHDICHAFAHVAAAMGEPSKARQWWRRGQASLRASGNLTMLYGHLASDLIYAVVPYFGDDLAERERLGREVEETRQLAGSSRNTNDAPGQAPIWYIAGRWTEMRATFTTFDQVRQFYVFMRPFYISLAQGQGDTDLVSHFITDILPSGPHTTPGMQRFPIALATQRAAIILALEAGDLPTARAWLDAHDRWLTWGDAALGRSEGEALWARYYRQAGDSRRAREYAERALAHATEPHQPLALLAAHRLRGEIDTDAGRFDDAAAHLDAALALADACAAPYERALTLLARAEYHVAVGELADAAATIDEARAILVALGARPALARADALAQRLTSAPRPTPAYPAGLSAREVEVLRLVSAGLTNPQVAAHLFLSPRTVQQHLRSIYNKLGVPTRAAATRFALEHHLG